MEKPEIDFYGYIKENKTESAIIGASAIIVVSAKVASLVMERLAKQQYMAGFAGTSDAIHMILDLQKDNK